MFFTFAITSLVVILSEEPSDCTSCEVSKEFAKAFRKNEDLGKSIAGLNNSLRYAKFNRKDNLNALSTEEDSADENKAASMNRGHEISIRKRALQEHDDLHDSQDNKRKKIAKENFENARKEDIEEDKSADLPKESLEERAEDYANQKTEQSINNDFHRGRKPLVVRGPVRYFKNADEIPSKFGFLDPRMIEKINFDHEHGIEHHGMHADENYDNHKDPWETRYFLTRRDEFGNPKPEYVGSSQTEDEEVRPNPDMMQEILSRSKTFNDPDETNNQLNTEQDDQMKIKDSMINQEIESEKHTRAIRDAFLKGQGISPLGDHQVDQLPDAA